MFEFRFIFANLGKYKPLYIFALSLSVITSIMVVIVPAYIREIVDKVIIGGQYNLLLGFVLAVIFITLLKTLLRYIMTQLLEFTTQKMILNVRERCFYSISHQEQGFFSGTTSGEIMTRLTADIDLIRHASAWISYVVIDAITMLIASIIFLLQVNLVFTLSILAVSPIVAFVSAKMHRSLHPMYVKIRESLSKLNTVARENIEGIRIVKSTTNEENEFKEFTTVNDNYRKMNVRTNDIFLKYFPITEFISQAIPVIMIAVGGALIIVNGEGFLTIGDLLLFSTLSGLVMAPMRTLGMVINDITRFFTSCRKVIDIYFAKPLIMENQDGIKKGERYQGTVEFVNVSFKYKNDYILKNISFFANAGETIVIMGQAGSGKTTIANLIPRLYDVTDGMILVDGIDVRKYSLEELRSNIAAATQDVFIFSDTIAGNIAFSNPSLSMDEIVEFAKAADAHNFILKTENGYDTVVGEKGIGLSGGQKQRLALARALAKRPAILILDDTTSALDFKTEKYINEAMEDLPFRPTKIIVASRISSAKNADKILFLQNGEIIEMGNHDELMSQRGAYYEVYKSQLKEEVI